MKQDIYLTSFDGTSASTIRSSVVEFTVNSGWLYVLGSDGRITRSENLKTWCGVDTAPSNSTSIEIYASDIFVGTTEGKVYRSIGAVAPNGCSTIVPILKLLLLD